MRSRIFLFLTILILCAGTGLYPANAATLFGLVDTGELFSSSDDGATWTVRATIAVSDAVGIAAAKTSEDLFIATQSGLLYRSVDAGYNWTAVGSVPATDVVDMLIRADGTILLLTRTGTLWGSADEGANFVAYAAIPASNHVSLSADTAKRLYALTETGEVARSTDDGVSWNTVGAVTASDAVDILADGSDVFVLTSTGIIARSGDQGDSWLFVSTVSHVNMIGLTRNEAGLAAINGAGLFWTSVDGSSWALVGTVSQVGVLAVGNDDPTASGIGRDRPPTIAALHIRPLWPNPLGGGGGSVSVRFELATSDRVGLDVYDVSGKLVGSAAPQDFATGGEHMMQWNPGTLASGVYFVRLVTASGLSAKTKLAIVR
jgi:hypothetical protein